LVVPITTSAKYRDKAAEELRAKDPAQWTETEVDKYLGFSLWSYFSGVEIYKEIMGYPADDPQWLVDVGYLKTWPLNPFDDWRPVKLLTPEDGFSAGDIVVQLDPDGGGGYELGIYGATEDTPLIEWCRPFAGHEEWADVLPGMRYMVGAPKENMTEVSRIARGR